MDFSNFDNKIQGVEIEHYKFEESGSGVLVREDGAGWGVGELSREEEAGEGQGPGKGSHQHWALKKGPTKVEVECKG